MIRYKGKDLTEKQFLEEVTKQPMPPPHTKEKIWQEVIKDASKEKTIFVHDNIEGKRCHICDKELKPNKIFWYTARHVMLAVDPKTKQTAETVVCFVYYSCCSKRCILKLVRDLESDAKELAKKSRMPTVSALER